MRVRLFLFVLLIALLHAGSTFAAVSTPVGIWTTIDDHSHKPRALVEISEIQGTLRGRIVHLFPAPDVDAQARCEKCDGSRHNQPVLGMTILWGFRRDGDHWDDGQILDPESGHVYRCTLSVSGNGRYLDVRGYIGLPLFGRSQVWRRAEPVSLKASP